MTAAIYAAGILTGAALAGIVIAVTTRLTIRALQHNIATTIQLDTWTAADEHAYRTHVCDQP